jgi:hypothetical protein
LLKCTEFESAALADQDGAAVDLPQGEQKALVMAMSFHEKGQVSIY